MRYMASFYEIFGEIFEKNKKILNFFRQLWEEARILRALPENENGDEAAALERNGRDLVWLRSGEEGRSVGADGMGVATLEHQTIEDH